MPWSIACSCISISWAPVSETNRSMGNALFKALLGLRSHIFAFSSEPKTRVACSIVRSSLCTRSDSSRLNSASRLASVRGGATSLCSSYFENPLWLSFEMRSFRTINLPCRASLERLDNAEPAKRFDAFAVRRLSLSVGVCFACFAICRKYIGYWPNLQVFSPLFKTRSLLFKHNDAINSVRNLYTNYWPGRCLIAEFREWPILASDM